MGRHKKHQPETEENEAKPVVHGDAKRSVAAIFLFALAILFVLGFLSAAKIVDAGLLGKFLNSLAGWMFGVGKYVSPVILVAAGVILLFRKETIFYVSKLLGIFLAFVSVLALVHILSYSSDQMLSAALHGSGGGFIGYVPAYLLAKLTRTIGGSVILVAIFLIGVIIAFNLSLAKLIDRFFHREIQGSGEETEKGEKDIIEDPIVIGKKEEEEEEEKEKEGQVEFVKDPNEKEAGISEKILQKAAAWVPKELRRSEKPQQSEQLDWELPTTDLLETYTGKAQGGDVKNNVKIIQDTFRHFGIDVELGEIKTGPTVTQYSFRPAVGVKLTRITSLSNDLALALAAHPIRIEAPIPGKSLIGIEVPNKAPALVRLAELLQSSEFKKRQSNLFLALGKDVSGDYIFSDLKKMPHLLIAGSTNSGKSVCVNSILMSLLYQNSPQDLKLILVDPKRVELTLYNGIPHLLSDVIVDNGRVLSALKWAIAEMERRYKLLQSAGSRDIASFNQKASDGETRVYVDPETNQEHAEPIEKIPYIVIVIDELADLMTSHGREVEGAVIRLAQMSRAVGIHLILSTQKPIVTVITSLIKSNIPTRIAFKVPALMDSRTILDASGAEKLLGNGDMLFSSAATQGLRRLQGVYVSENEVNQVVEFISRQKFEKMEDDLEDDIAGDETAEHKGERNGEVTTTYSEGKIDFASVAEDNQEDSRYEEAKQVVVQAGKASSSLLQRRLRIGYSRAARLIDILEERGIIGPADGARPREVLIGGKSEQPVYEDSIQDQTARDKWQM